MGKSSIRPVPPQMTEEQKKEQIARAFMQKRASLAEGILFNLCSNQSIISTAFAEPGKVAEAAIKITDALMEQLYGKTEE